MSAPAATHHGGHGHVKEWRQEPIYGAASQGQLGMCIFLLSDAFSVGVLLLAYGILRRSGEGLRHPGEPILAINFTAGLTSLLICSTVTMVMAHAAIVEGNRKQAMIFLAATAIGGML